MAAVTYLTSGGPRGSPVLFLLAFDIESERNVRGPRTMANFQILETSEDISSFDLPLNRTVKLKQWGGDGDGNRLEVGLEAPVPGVTLTVLPDRLASASTAFTLQGTQMGATGNVAGFVAGSGQTQHYSGKLKIKVCGQPRKCAGYDVDLLSDLAIKGNGVQIRTYTKILGGTSDKHNMLSQDPDKAVLDCGDVAGGYGSKLFGKPSSTAWFAYYSKPSTDKRADLRFEPNMMRGKINRIKTLLNEGTSVRVWVVDSDGFSIPSIQSNANNTHFITIVGYSDAASRFMFIDPWPGGSSMSYDGGMYAATPLAFFGELMFEPMNIEKGIRSPAATGGTIRSGGTMSYTVIAGP